MPHVATSSTYQQLRLKDFEKVKTRDYKHLAFTVISFILAAITIGLAIRLIGSLFLMTDVFSRGVTVLTEPAVQPFNNIFHDAHEMLQISTAAAFSAYYVFFGVLRIVARRLLRLNRQRELAT